MEEAEYENEVRIAIEALRQANRAMIAYELDQGDGEDTFLGEGSDYERIKGRVDAAIAAIEDSGLTEESAAKGTLALIEAVLLTTYASHMEMVGAAVRMTEAASVWSMRNRDTGLSRLSERPSPPIKPATSAGDRKPFRMRDRSHACG